MKTRRKTRHSIKRKYSKKKNTKNKYSKKKNSKNKYSKKKNSKNKYSKNKYLRGGASGHSSPDGQMGPDTHESPGGWMAKRRAKSASEKQGPSPEQQYVTLMLKEMGISKDKMKTVKNTYINVTCLVLDEEYYYIQGGGDDKRELITSWSTFRQGLKDEIEHQQGELKGKVITDEKIKAQREMLKVAVAQDKSQMGDETKREMGAETAEERASVRGEAKLVTQSERDAFAAISEDRRGVGRSKVDSRLEFLRDFYSTVGYEDFFEEEIILKVPAIKSTDAVTHTFITRNLLGEDEVGDAVGTYIFEIRTFKDRRSEYYAYPYLKYAEHIPLEIVPESGQMRVVKTAVIRSGAALDSPQVGELQRGDVIDVLETRQVSTADGTSMVRVRCAAGWTSVTADLEMIYEVDFGQYRLEFSRAEVLKLLGKCQALLSIWILSEMITDTVAAPSLQKLNRLYKDLKNSDLDAQAQTVQDALNVLRDCGFLIELLNTLCDPYGDVQGEWVSDNEYDPEAKLTFKSEEELSGEGGTSEKAAQLVSEGALSEKGGTDKPAPAAAKLVGAGLASMLCFVAQAIANSPEWPRSVNEVIRKVPGKVTSLVQGGKEIAGWAIDRVLTAATLAQLMFWHSFIWRIASKLGLLNFFRECNKMVLRNGLNDFRTTGQGLTLITIRRVLSGIQGMNTIIQTQVDLVVSAWHLRDLWQRVVAWWENYAGLPDRLGYAKIALTVAMNGGEAEPDANDLWNQLCATLSGCEIDESLPLLRKLTQRREVANSLVACMEDINVCTDALSYLNMQGRLDWDKLVLLMDTLQKSKVQATPYETFKKQLGLESEQIQIEYTGTRAENLPESHKVLGRAHVLQDWARAEAEWEAGSTVLTLHDGDIINITAFSHQENESWWKGWVEKERSTGLLRDIKYNGETIGFFPAEEFGYVERYSYTPGASESQAEIDMAAAEAVRPARKAFLDEAAEGVQPPAAADQPAAAVTGEMEGSLRAIITPSEFSIGERVERRDQGNDWVPGHVTSLDPLMVTANEVTDKGYSWDEVRKLVEVAADVVQEEKTQTQSSSLWDWGRSAAGTMGGMVGAAAGMAGQAASDALWTDQPAAVPMEVDLATADIPTKIPAPDYDDFTEDEYESAGEEDKKEEDEDEAGTLEPVRNMPAKRSTGVMVA
jgi:hypothetical protein